VIRRPPYRCCEDFLHDHQGRTFGAPGRPVLADLAADALDLDGKSERAVQLRGGGRGDGDSRRGWRGSLARFLLRDSAPSRAAARRADAPHPAAARTRRNAPWVMRSASWPGRSLRAKCANRCERSQRRGGMPRIVRAGPSSVKGTPRSFLTASQKRSSGPTLERRSLYQPSGPDGEGQAKGQARNARGIPPAISFFQGSED
jgi:hypothetical protein